MTIHPIIRKLPMMALKFLVFYIMITTISVCYFEFGHDKGWPLADLMYFRFHKFVVAAVDYGYVPADMTAE
ncbi:hypothetical protein [Prevotella sp.]|uniref:hypothetical protein n=1 Tax=Prevotella sp. TaxID=59823 RepID=UPI00307C16C7